MKVFIVIAIILVILELDDINTKLKELEALINGQETLQKHITEQKAEIERLQNAYKQCAWERDVFLEGMKEEVKKEVSIFQVDTNKVKSEARKEFWDRLKKEAITKYDWNDYIEMECGDNLLKEIEQEENK